MTFKSRTGFEPRTSPAERRAFFDLVRQISNLERKVEELETRIAALENP